MGRPVDYALIYRLEDERFERERAYVCPMWEYVKDQAARHPNWDRLPVQNDMNGEVRLAGRIQYTDACVGEIDQCRECGHTNAYHHDDVDGWSSCRYGTYFTAEEGWPDRWISYPCNCGNNIGR